MSGGDRSPPVGDPYADRKRLTFEQAEGREPLPAQLRLGEISPKLASLLWAYIHSSLKESVSHDEFFGTPYIDGRWRDALFSYHVVMKHRAAEEFSARVEDLIPEVKLIILSNDYIGVLGFIEFVLRIKSEIQIHGFSDNIEYICRFAPRTDPGFPLRTGKTWATWVSSLLKHGIRRQF